VRYASYRQSRGHTPGFRCRLHSHEACDINARGHEEKVMNVLGWHHPSRFGLSVKGRHLVSMDIEVGGRAESVAVDRVAGIPEAAQVCERRLDVCAGVSLFDFDEHKRQQPAERRLTAAEDSKLVSLHVALDEVDALKSEIIESPPLDANGPVRAHRPRKTCQAIGNAIADDRKMERGVACLIGECEWVEVNTFRCLRDRSQRPCVLWVRLKGMDDACGANDASEQGCVGPPARADVNRDIAGPHQLLCQTRGIVALESLSLEIKTGAKPRRCNPREANDGTEQVDSTHARASPIKRGVDGARRRPSWWTVIPTADLRAGRARCRYDGYRLGINARACLDNLDRRSSRRVPSVTDVRHADPGEHPS
jgi:hypothetical protein